MTRTVVRPQSFVIPRRPCSACGRVEDVLHMTLVARSLLCAACVRGDPPPAEAGGPARQGAAVDDPTARALHRLGGHHGVAERLRRMDATLRYAWIAVRLVGYVWLVWLAKDSELWSQILAGVLIADVGTWAMAAWFDMQAHRFALALELAAYLVVGHLWLGGGGTLALPADAVGRGIALLSFGAVFTAKGSLLLYKVMYGGRDD